MDCTPALNNPIRSNNSLSRIILSSLTRNNPAHSTPTLNNPIRSNIILSDPTSKNTPLIKPTHSHSAL
ncbi:unnamed protein product [Boreogadus saida]